MPALNHPHLPHTETLANGLRISVRHAPHLKRCAASVRVNAGSHDVPPAWPGLAHFLEHLMFLGTERFAAQQGLMAYVQGHGGQVNAQTRERSTEYFFELPPAAFAGGLERLCDMLAHPRLAEDDQLREREVLHAEFIAWSRDATAQRQFSLFDRLSAAHPLRAFHAGNRYSLPVPRPAFRQALGEFYQTFYQAGQMTLSLAGPQPLQVLRALAERCGGEFAQGAPVPQELPPGLQADGPGIYPRQDGRHLDLLLCAEPLPEGAAEALEVLCIWLASSKPGGLVAELKTRGLIDGLKAAPLYHFAGQAVVHVDIGLTPQGLEQTPLIRQQVQDWLGFFATQTDWPKLSAEYARLQQRRQQVAGALELARFDSEQRQGALTGQGLAALQALLQQLQAKTGEPLGMAWQLPPANPFLTTEAEPPRAGLIRGQTSKHRGLRTFAQDRSRGRLELPALNVSQALPEDTGEAALYLRWRLHQAAPAGLLPALVRSLHELQVDARQAGVEVTLHANGQDWLLKMTGHPQPLPAILTQVLKQLSQPAAAMWLSSEPAAAPLIPIRQLLKALAEPQWESAATNDAAALQLLWDGARWDGLGLGLPEATQNALKRALGKMPGSPDSALADVTPSATGYLWQTLDCDSSEHALLLFCPAPSTRVEDEAAWRLLGQLCQAPFYQRLRVELQLGYAVFSGVRQINGRTGLLFGVQSPGAPVPEILEHIRQFLQQLPTLLAELDPVELASQRQRLAAQFDPTGLGLTPAAELLWHSAQAGHPSDYLQQLQPAIEGLSVAALQDAARRLNHAEGGWRCLATGVCPGAPWQVQR